MLKFNYIDNHRVEGRGAGTVPRAMVVRPAELFGEESGELKGKEGPACGGV